MPFRTFITLLVVSYIPDSVESQLFCCIMLSWVFKHQQPLSSGLEIIQFLLVWIFHVGSALVLSEIAMLTSCRILTPSSTSSPLGHTGAVGSSFVLWDMSGAWSWLLLTSPPPSISRCSRYSPTTKFLFWPTGMEVVLISDLKQRERQKKHIKKTPKYNCMVLFFSLSFSLSLTIIRFLIF